MIHFKGCHFPKEIILMAIRWYIAHPLSYRHVEELMEERGLNLIMRQWIVGSSSILPLLNLSFGSSKSQSAKAGVYGCDRTKKASRSRLSLFKRGLRLLRRCCFLDNSTESLWLYSNWWVIRSRTIHVTEIVSTLVDRNWDNLRKEVAMKKTEVKILGPTTWKH